VSSLSDISKARPSRHSLPSGLALSGAVCCSSQRTANSVYFTHASVANILMLLDQGVGNDHIFICRTLSNPLCYGQ